MISRNEEKYDYLEKSLYSLIIMSLVLLFTLNLAFTQNTSAATLSLASGTGSRGNQITLALDMTSQTSESPTAVQLDLTYDSKVLSYVTATIGSAAAAAGKLVVANDTGGTITILIFGINVNVINNGTIANITFSIKNNAAPGATTIAIVNPIITDNASPPGTIPLTSIVNGVITVADPTLVELGQFSAASQGNQIILTWNTLSEKDNAGFNVWRSEAEKEPYIKINSKMIEATGGATLSAEYAYTDDTARPGVTYYYKLEDIDTKGIRTFHGPVSAVIPAPKPATPAYYPSWFGWYPQSLWPPLYSTQYPDYSFKLYPCWWCSQTNPDEAVNQRRLW